MSRAPFLLAPLDASHDRTRFSSDSEPLNHYLREQATQDIRRRVADPWLRQWVHVIPFFAYPPAVRKIIYTPTPYAEFLPMISAHRISDTI